MAYFNSTLQEQVIERANSAVLRQSPQGEGDPLTLTTKEHVYFAACGYFVYGGQSPQKFRHLPFFKEEYRTTGYPCFALVGYDHFDIIKFGFIQPVMVWENQMQQSFLKYSETHGKGIDKGSLMYALRFLQCIPLPTITDLISEKDVYQWKPFIKTFIGALHGLVDEWGYRYTAGDVEMPVTLSLCVPPALRDTLLVGVFNTFLSNVAGVDYGTHVADTMGRLSEQNQELQSGNVSASVAFSREEGLLVKQFLRPRTSAQCVFNSMQDPTDTSLRGACVAYFRWTFKVIRGHMEDEDNSLSETLPPDSLAGTIHLAWYSTSTEDEDPSPSLDN